MQYRRGIPKQPNNNDKKVSKDMASDSQGFGAFFLQQAAQRIAPVLDGARNENL